MKGLNFGVAIAAATVAGGVFAAEDNSPGFVKVEWSEKTVASPDADVIVPIEVKGFGLKPFYGVVRDGTWEHEFKDAATDKVVVTNLADGKNA